MKKFLLLYMSPVSAEEQMKNADPSKVADSMKPWMEWFAKLGDKVVDMGMPTSSGATVTSTERMPSQAPFLGGYSIISADSKEDAEKLLAGHPHLSMPGASIQISELMPMPGM